MLLYTVKGRKHEIFEHFLLLCEMILFFHFDIALEIVSTDIDFKKKNGRCYGVFKGIIEFSHFCNASNRLGIFAQIETKWQLDVLRLMPTFQNFQKLFNFTCITILLT